MEEDRNEKRKIEENDKEEEEVFMGWCRDASTE